MLPASFPARYTLESVLGRGGMGTVYRVRDSVLGRTLALKRLESLGEDFALSSSSTRNLSRPGASKATSETLAHARKRAQLVGMFQREYQTLSQLGHPNIITVHDYGLDGLGPFYTMELLEGFDLSKAGVLPWRAACGVARDVAAALTLLHSRHLLHRDISPRNVHLVAGVSKLIDFGAMTPMGPTKLIVGTPPFMAPEVLQQQPLDARADLYSLGAFVYAVLTGCNAYPARSLVGLREAFRVRPAPPSKHVSDIPRALDELVMQLLSQDRAARPTSAIEVMERFAALAGLEHDQSLCVPHAYLDAPTLVGCTNQLLSVRRRVMRARRGRGACLLVSGAPGSGRTRFLDACALEGKLNGALVLRADGADRGSGAYGALRSLLGQLHASLTPEERVQSALPVAARAAIVPHLVWTEPPPARTSMRPVRASAPPPVERARVHDAVESYLSGLAAQRPMLITIDDLEELDEPSAAVLVALALRTRSCKLVIVAACDPGAPVAAPEAVRMLGEHARALQLSPFTEAQIAMLLRSVFGDVPNLALVTSRIHALSAGNPRTCMELAQHLLDRGTIRYESGGFTVPDALGTDELPSSLGDALRARVARLSDDARELGAIVALCGGDPLHESDAHVLMAHVDAQRSRQAIAELVAGHILAARDDQLLLRQAALAQVCLVDVPAEHLHRLHGRMAECFASDPQRQLRAAEHYFRAGMDAHALDILILHASNTSADVQWFESLRGLLEEALRACQRLDRPASEAYALRRLLSHHIMHFLEPCSTEQLLAVGDELYRACGLADHDELHEEPDPRARLQQAFARAAERHAQAPVAQRTLTPEQAIVDLALISGAAIGYGSSALDVELLERLPAMAPYAVLSPGIQLVESLREALRHLRAGRTNRCITTLRAVVARLDEPDHAGLGDVDHAKTKHGILYAIGMSEASFGHPRALECATQLETQPSQRLNAWRVRQIAHLYRADIESAEACRRQYELLQIREGARQFHHGVTVETEFIFYGRAGDLLGLRRVMPQVEALAARHPGWRAPLALARGELERLRGRPELALSFYEQAEELAPAGKHMYWQLAAGFRVLLLADMSRAEEAKRLGLEGIAICDKYELAESGCSLYGGVALAEAALGNHASALAYLAPLIELADSGAMRGLHGGALYEIGAQVALLMGDAASFSRYLERCRELFNYGHYAPLTARVDRLVSAARKQGLSGFVSIPPPPRRHVTAERVRCELAACSDPEAHAARALALLMEASGAHAGHLFGVQQAGLVLLASAAPRAPSPALEAMLQRFLAGDVLDEQTTVCQPSDPALPSPSELRDAAEYETFPLSVPCDGNAILCALAVLAIEPRARRNARKEAMQAIASGLFERTDITGLTLRR